MPLPKLNLPVPQEGYSVTPGEAVLRAKLSAGPSRTRLDMLGAAQEAEISLVLEPIQYQYWQAFYRSIIVQGSLPFLLSMIYDFAAPADYEVKIIPGSIRLGVQGEAHLVQFQAEVKAQDVDEDYDAAIVELIGILGPETGYFFNLFDHLVNVDFPALMP